MVLLHQHRKGYSIAVLLAGLLTAIPWHAVIAQQPNTNTPSELELAFWRSAEQIGTEEAYRAYLSKFPNGYFAPLAVAATNKAQPPKPSPPPSPASRPSSVAVDPARIARPTDSSAVSFAIGDIFQGPGVVTVGWLGAKKQLVLPPGRWVVLSAADSYSTHSRPVQLATVVVGRFEGSSLVSTIEAIINSRPGTSLYSNWDEMTRCETSDPAAGYQARTSLANVATCTKLKTIKPNPPVNWKRAWLSVRSALEKLESSFDPGTALAYQFVQQDNRGNFQQILRVDYGWKDAVESQQGAPTNPAGLPVDRIEWARSYQDLAAKGIGKNLPFEDIPAGGASSTTTIALDN